MANFYKDVIMKHKDFKSTKPISSLDLLEPVTREAVEKIIKDSDGKFMVYETYRSTERQEELFKEEIDQAQERRRAPLRPRLRHRCCPRAASLPLGRQAGRRWKELAKLATDAGLISGLDWGEPGKKHGFVDEDHVQRIRVAHQEGLFAGKWYPNEKYNPFDKATWPK